MNKLEHRWWFVTLAAIATIGSTCWLFRTLGLGYPGDGYSFAHLVLLLVSIVAFQNFFSHVIWSFLLWFVRPGSARND